MSGLLRPILSHIIQRLQHIDYDNRMNLNIKFFMYYPVINQICHVNYMDFINKTSKYKMSCRSQSKSFYTLDISVHSFKDLFNLINSKFN